MRAFLHTSPCVDEAGLLQTVRLQASLKNELPPIPKYDDFSDNDFASTTNERR
ncbi:hypothetical protein IEO21_09790 [Rhodonia placenta]|uniref:Uncharacterized protein n=1 Tax=Rhodonia placenta TaxID=104341 RepID=A0A8H7NTT0_9APHY|nr:hypothetical protein IEO21_09790 [Postia placenta]